MLSDNKIVKINNNDNTAMLMFYNYLKFIGSPNHRRSVTPNFVLKGRAQTIGGA